MIVLLISRIHVQNAVMRKMVLRGIVMGDFIIFLLVFVLNVVTPALIQVIKTQFVPVVI